jgi:hypothetical protein
MKAAANLLAVAARALPLIFDLSRHSELSLQVPFSGKCRCPYLDIANRYDFGQYHGIVNEIVVLYDQ